MKKLENYRDFSQHAADMERVGAYEQAEAAWEKASVVACKSVNEEWALNRRAMCAHLVKYPDRRPGVKND